MIQRIATKIAPYPKSPTPQARPAAISKKIKPISFGSPGALN